MTKLTTGFPCLLWQFKDHLGVLFNGLGWDGWSQVLVEEFDSDIPWAWNSPSFMVVNVR